MKSHTYCDSGEMRTSWILIIYDISNMKNVCSFKRSYIRAYNLFFHFENNLLNRVSVKNLSEEEILINSRWLPDVRSKNLKECT